MLEYQQFRNWLPRPAAFELDSDAIAALMESVDWLVCEAVGHMDTPEGSGPYLSSMIHDYNDRIWTREFSDGLFKLASQPELWALAFPDSDSSAAATRAMEALRQIEAAESISGEQALDLIAALLPLASMAGQSFEGALLTLAGVLRADSPPALLEALATHLELLEGTEGQLPEGLEETTALADSAAAAIVLFELAHDRRFSPHYERGAHRHGAGLAIGNASESPLDRVHAASGRVHSNSCITDKGCVASFEPGYWICLGAAADFANAESAAADLEEDWDLGLGSSEPFALAVWSTLPYQFLEAAWHLRLLPEAYCIFTDFVTSAKQFQIQLPDELKNYSGNLLGIEVTHHEFGLVAVVGPAGYCIRTGSGLRGELVTPGVMMEGTTATHVLMALQNQFGQNGWDSEILGRAFPGQLTVSMRLDRSAAMRLEMQARIAGAWWDLVEDRAQFQNIAMRFRVDEPDVSVFLPVGTQAAFRQDHLRLSGGLGGIEVSVKDPGYLARLLEELGYGWQNSLFL